MVVAEGHGGERERERKEREIAKLGKMAGFLADFGSDFLLIQTLKSTSIYRRWKRAVLSTLRKISAIDSVGKDPNRWFKVSILSCQICRKKAD